MKKSRIIYRIPEPCHEGWENMTPTEKGRFCGSCAKPVVDFTRMSDQQIHRTMNESTGSVCGRMTVSQINREMTMGYHHQPAFSLHALMLGTALVTFSAVQANAQGGVANSIEQTKKGRVVEEPVLMGDIAPEQNHHFTGKVMSLGNGFIAGTSVTVYDEAGKELVTTLTNDEGEFDLKIDSSLVPYRIVFRKEEYLDNEFLIAEFLTLSDHMVLMHRSDEMIEGLIIRDYQR